MTQSELLADVCMRNLEMLTMSLADFSDAEMLVRPCPDANHPAWQVGHLISAEYHLVNACKPGAIPSLPIGFADRFTPKTARIDDPAAFIPKAQLLDLFTTVRTAAADWVRSLDAAAMSQPGPDKMRQFLPTVGHVAFLLPQHLAMHLGQLQVLRRKLGKPVLF